MRSPKPFAGEDMFEIKIARKGNEENVSKDTYWRYTMACKAMDDEDWNKGIDFVIDTLEQAKEKLRTDYSRDNWYAAHYGIKRLEELIAGLWKEKDPNHTDQQ